MKDAPANSPIFPQGQNIKGLLEQKAIWMRQQIADMTEASALGLNEEEFVEKLISAQRLTPISIISDPHKAGTDNPTGYDHLVQRETVIIAVVLEFTGDSILLTMLPSQYPVGQPPRGQVRGNKIYFEHVFDSLDKPETMKRRIDDWANAIRGLVAQQTRDMESWTVQMKRGLLKTIQERKLRFAKTKAIIDAVEIPLLKREDPAGTFAVPLERRQLELTNQTVGKPTTSAAVAVPVLKTDDYEEILTHLRHMCRTMERFPEAFENLKEEQIRAFFLMHLNGHYKGAAVGEAFSSRGKTDIYLPYKNGQVFIAECKFWEGPKAFPKIYAQLQGYLTWRDTKTAILLFVQNEAIQGVLDQIPSLISKLPGFKEILPLSEQGEFRARLEAETHADKRVILTVQTFHLRRSET